MESLSTARVVLLPREDKVFGFGAPIKQSRVPELRQSMQDAVLEEERRGTENVEDKHANWVTRCVTGDCHNCATSDDEIIAIVFVSHLTGDEIRAQYCYECASSVVEQLTEYLENHTDELLGDTLPS